MAHFHRRKDANIKLNNHEMKEVEEEITEWIKLQENFTN
jgi:hypothetical protein